MPPFTIKHLQAYVPENRHDQFHLALAVLHASGAIGASLMCLICDGIPHATHRAMVPTTIPVAGSNFSEVLAFRAAFPWSEDRVLGTHLWNPFILVAAFEWLTAAFALCNTRQWLPPDQVRTVAEIWLAVGAGLVAVWYIFPWTREDGFCLAMLVTLGVSFGAAVMVIGRYYELNAPVIPSAVVVPPEDPGKNEEVTVVTPPEEPQGLPEDPRGLPEEQAHLMPIVRGKTRVW
jgi:hypothetical protein